MNKIKSDGLGDYAEENNFTYDEFNSFDCVGRDRGVDSTC